ncbi:MAG: hypothetical protein WDW36_000546 [Sanguina aurantia]
MMATRFCKSLIVQANCRAARNTIAAPFKRFLKTTPQASASDSPSPVENVTPEHAAQSSEDGRPHPATSSTSSSALPAFESTISGPPARLLGSNIARSYSQHVKGNLDILRQLLVPPQVYAKDNSLDSIIKIFTVHSRPNHFLPWQNHPKRESTGTGFIVHNRLILTNAHVVADSTYVLVKRHGSGTKYRADVQAVGHDCDLALLSVEDEAFWSTPTDMLPLELGPLPSLQTNVVVVGYPTGGDNTSVTSGVVSRVEVAQYVHAASYLMAIQIDAAINPGNSGGPALQGDQVVGVAFQNLPSADNIGYIIPTTVVQRFLQEVAGAGTYLGYCSLGVMCQNLENPHLRRALGMAAGQTGILVNSIAPTSTTASMLHKGDVLLAFDGVTIANDGTVHLRHRERIYFSSLVTQKPSGGTAVLKVLRDGAPLEFNVDVQPNDQLVPVHQYDRLPSYYIFAGLVFVPLSQPFLHEYGGDGGDWASSSPRRLYDKAMHSSLKIPGQQVVVVSQVLADDANTGYQQFQTLQVLRVNGVTVLNLRHLKELVEGAGQEQKALQVPALEAVAAGSDGNGSSSAPAAADGVPISAVVGSGSGAYVRFELEDDRIMVIDKALAVVAQQRILDRYRVPAAESVDLAK